MRGNMNLKKFDGYDCIADESVIPDKTYQFGFSTSENFYLSTEDETMKLAYSCINASLKTFMESKKDEYYFFSPVLILQGREVKAKISVKKKEHDEQE